MSGFRAVVLVLTLLGAVMASEDAARAAPAPLPPRRPREQPAMARLRAMLKAHGLDVGSVKRLAGETWEFVLRDRSSGRSELTLRVLAPADDGPHAEARAAAALTKALLEAGFLGGWVTP
jgi:hypothetical protein